MKYLKYLLFALLFPITLLAQDVRLANGYAQKADNFYEKAYYDSAIIFMQQAASIYRSSGRLAELYHAENRLAECLLRQGNVEESVKQADNARKNQTERFTPQEAENQNLLGEIALVKGSTDLALDFFQNALSIFKKLGYSDKIEAADCYDNLGIAYWNNLNSDLAEEYLLKALNSRKNLLGENHTLVAASYNNLGLVYANEQPAKAQEYYEKALDIYQILYGEKHPTIINAYNNLAIAYKNQKNSEFTLFYLEKSEKLSLEIYGAAHSNTAFVYANLGQFYAEQNEAKRALDYQEKALAIYKQRYPQGKHPEIANTYNLIGGIYGQQQKIKEALQAYQAAIVANVSDFNEKDVFKNPKTWKNYFNGNTLLVSLLLKAQMMERSHVEQTLRLKDMQSALSALQLCDSLVDHIRQSRSSKADKLALGQIASEVYEEGIGTCLTLSKITLKPDFYKRLAFYFNEKSKSAVLLQAISETAAKSFAGVPADLQEQEKNLKTDIAFYEQQIAEKPNDKIIGEKLFELNRQYETFIKNLEKQFPDYFNLKFSAKIASVADVQKIMKPETMLISYFVADSAKRVYIFRVSNNFFDVIDVAKNPNFDADLKSLRNIIFYKIGAKFADLSYTIYKQLFPKSLPTSIKNIIIVPDGRLGMTPFEVLLTQKTVQIGTKHKHYDFKTMPYLLNKYAVSYAYAATLLLNKHKEPLTNTTKKALLCAPVSFSYPQRSLNTLPASENEVRKISELLNSNQVQSLVLLRRQARESFMKSDSLRDFNYIHFATHGVVNESSPELSQIFLMPDSVKKDDGYLFSGEIYNLDLRADLVTLSACQTGLGKVSKGEGIIGLTRALLYAGAQNVVVSLWSVADASTSRLMIDLYANLLKTNNKAEALRQAKLKMIREGALKDGKGLEAYFWSPFVLIGE